MLAFSLVKLKKFKNANECLKNVELLTETQKITDQELLQGTKELWDTVRQQLQDPEDMGEQEQNEEEGYETYSEEDLSDDEKM